MRVSFLYRNQKMAQRSVNPARIQTLRDWAARVGKASNLGFDEETREPTIYSADGKGTKVSSIPWKREGDTLTILGTPSRFSAQAVEAAKSRYGRIQEQRVALRAGANEQVRILEAALLDAWRTYEAAEAGARPALRRDVLTAERALREQEESMASRERMAVEYPTGQTGIYMPPMPVARRGIAVAGGGAAASE
jgi:hypothetical protein